MKNKIFAAIRTLFICILIIASVWILVTDTEPETKKALGGSWTIIVFLIILRDSQKKEKNTTIT